MYRKAATPVSAMLRLAFGACALLAVPLRAQPLFINEAMSSNTATLADERGAYPDWIELYNGGDDTLQLGGWGLTDDPDRPFRWTFPDLRLAPGAYRVVFASGRDQRAVVSHLETVLDRGDEWHYFVGTTAPPPAWNAPDFDASAWLRGPGGFGYGDGDDATQLPPPAPMEPGPTSVYVRTTFSVHDPEAVFGLLLHVDYDDGFVAYLNGQEVARANMGTPGTPTTHDQFAERDHEAAIYRGGTPEAFRLELADTLLQPGENVLALEVHNAQRYSSDLTLIPFLTLEMAGAPPGARGPSAHLALTPPGLHTGFRLDAGGETLVLTSPSGTVADRVELPPLDADLSFGRQPDGGDAWRLFDVPTPGAANTTPGHTGVAGLPTFSHAGGFYGAPFALALAAPNPGAVVRYTLDGSTPADTSARYTAPLQIDTTAVVRARAFAPGMLPGRTVTHTFFVGETYPLPVVSLATTPAHLFDHETGIYVMGPGARPDYPHFGANFWKDWERPVHVEWFETAGSRGFGIDAGVQIFGSWSRLYPQKSLALFARGRYGDPAIPHPVFPELPFERYQALVLRNAGQDWGRTFFRDALVHQLVRHTGLDVQAYRPVLVFVNGRMWGLHNVREKLNEHYLAAHHGVDPDAIDLVERDTTVVHGDDTHYRALLAYVATHDLADADAYAHVRQQVDVDAFMDYVITLLYAANPDWPWNNVKAWRPRTPEGRWRWLLYDLDYAFHGGHLDAGADTFAELRSDQNRTTGTARLLFALLANASFQDAFLNRFADHLNSTFAPERVVAIIGAMQAAIAPAMPYHVDRWRGSFEGPWWLGSSIDSMEEWQANVEVAVNFARRRPEAMFRLLERTFPLTGGTGRLWLNTSPREGGRVRINTLTVETYPWGGTYFEDVPVTATALPHPGYRFAGWSGAANAATPSVTFSFSDSETLTAHFVPDTAAVGPVVINEINYNSAGGFDPEDWVELYNPARTELDLGGWTFKDGDDDHAFTLPAGTTLPAGGYLVLSRDTAAFRRHFPGVPVAGDLGFGLSSEGEAVRLFDAAGALVDSLTYGVAAPWPESPNGTGATLALTTPAADNTRPEAWAAAPAYGTPGAANEVIGTGREEPADGAAAFALESNYPNPFARTTTFAFTLPEAAHVTLTLYAVTGRAVATVVDGHLPAGRHHVRFDASALSSGLYLYRLRSGTRSASRTLLLVR